jgi:hypothetical protein
MQTVPCTTPKCDKGKIPCPKLHLKLNEGTWYKKDGKMWRKFPYRGGYAEVSDGHLGQIIETVDGVPQPPKECPLCGGKMVIDDPKCHGTGVQPCNACATAAAKDPAQKCKDCERGQIMCKSCGGTGIKSMTTRPSE